jgi:predicted metal-dependent phosphotriesterase family hydrolase
MSKYTCEKCEKEFKQKSHYTSHVNKKNHCVVESKIKKANSIEFEIIDEDEIIYDNKLVKHIAEQMTEQMTEQMDISKMSKLELMEKCKEFGITKCSSKNKGELIDLINSKIHTKKK